METNVKALKSSGKLFTHESRGMKAWRGLRVTCAPAPLIAMEVLTRDVNGTTTLRTLYITSMWYRKILRGAASHTPGVGTYSSAGAPAGTVTTFIRIYTAKTIPIIMTLRSAKSAFLQKEH